MKKVEKVSIANISFTLDIDAYIALKQYIDLLHTHYDKDPDGREIIADIEARIAELILGEQLYTRIVSKHLVDRIIAQLGAPEEFDVQDDEAPAGAACTSQPSIPRRLYRSSEGRILGGVCRGMANFWDINVAWARLAFLAPLIVMIIWIPFNYWWQFENLIEGCIWAFAVLYIVLWFALPVARTPRQQLEARGKRITPSSIRQSFQETATTPSAKKAASVAAEIFAVLGRIVLFFIKFIVAVIGFAFLMVAFGVFVAMIVAIVNPVSLGALAIGSLAGLAILPPVLFVALVLFCVMIPMLVMAVRLLSLVFSWKPGRIFFGILLGVWLLAMILCSVVIAGNARYLRDGIREHGGVIELLHDRDAKDAFDGLGKGRRIEIDWQDATAPDTAEPDTTEPGPVTDTLTIIQ